MTKMITRFCVIYSVDSPIQAQKHTKPAQTNDTYTV